VTAAISLFVFGAVTAALSLQYPLGTLRMPGSGFFPLALGLALMALAAGDGIRVHSARRKATVPAAPAAPPADGAAIRVGLFLGAIAAATALLQPLGYALVSFLVMLALLQVLGVRRWLASGLIALGSAAASYLVFVQWLKIPLPSGWLY
jgi:hypothetical protein